MNAAPKTSSPPQSAWRHVKLGDVCSKPQYGWTTKATQDGGRLKLLRTTDITSGPIDWTTVPYCTESPPDVDKYLVREGDILISRAGSVGVSHLVTSAQPAVFASYLIRFKPGPEVLPKYLAYFLQSPSYWKQIADNTAGIAVPNVNASKLRELELPLAPPDVQERIVAEIEKQFSRLDDANDNLKRVGTGLKRYRAAVVDSAVDGRLASTEADLARRGKQGYEGGDQLLNRILEERRRKWRGKTKYKEPVPPRVTDLPHLPSGWVWASLDQLSWEAGYGTSVKCSYDEEGPPVLRIPNVENASLDFTDLKFGPASLAIRADDAVSAGDILVIRTNGSRSLIGRAAVVRATPRTQMTFASYLIRFRLLEAEALAAWVSTLWQSNRIRSWIESTAATSAGQYNISMTALATAAIPLPPLAEQRRITAEVDRQLSLVQGLESQLYANSLRANHLRESVLSIAFSGKA